MLVRKLTDPSVDIVVSKVKKQKSHNSLRAVAYLYARSFLAVPIGMKGVEFPTPRLSCPGYYIGGIPVQAS